MFASAYAVSFWVIAHGNAVQDARLVDAVEALSPEHIVRQLSIIGAHPVMGSGWFRDRWKAMDEASRRTWVEARLQHLRDLWLQGGEQGLAAHGLDLLMHLAVLDQQTQIDTILADSALDARAR